MRAVLTYHSIDDSGSPISVSADQFEAHCQFLSSAEVEVVSLTDLLASDTQTRPQVAITFDDGFVNFSTTALPRLHDHGLPATLFVVTGRVGGDNAWAGTAQSGIPTLPLLDWDGLGDVRDRQIALGAHTHTHPRLSDCSPAELLDEVVRPVEILQERLGVDATTFAYPYGDHNRSTVEVCSDHYDVACTTKLDTVGEEPNFHTIPRLDMYYFRDAGRLEAMGTSRFRAYLGLRKAMRSVRSMVLRS